MVENQQGLVGNAAERDQFIGCSVSDATLHKSHIGLESGIPQSLEINENPELVYKSYLLRDATGNHKKVEFDYKLPEKMTQKEKLQRSYNVLKRQGGIKGKQTLYVVNPQLFRKMKYEEAISPDVLNPLSEDLERQFGLAEWDRMVQQVPTGMYDAQETGKLLLQLFPKTKKDPDKFMAKQQSGQPNMTPIQQPPMNKMQVQNQKPMNPMQMKQPAGSPSSINIGQ